MVFTARNIIYKNKHSNIICNNLGIKKTSKFFSRIPRQLVRKAQLAFLFLKTKFLKNNL